MSSIDERIVQMEFDNSLFDKNVESSIKTLEKLNVALKMDGIDKNLADISSSVNKMDFSKVTNSIDSVQSKFSNLSNFLINGVSSLGSRISRAISGEIDRTIQGAIGSVKRLANELTIAPINQGFGEYELKMGSVQTIMASTGESLGTVNKYLDELNTYADKTIYSFSDMTSNIGKFTNAGVDLDTAVKAIQGISNAAALAGAGTNEASRAMYNFSQALSMGSVQLVDWKSIENANMATKEFKQTLIDTAVEVGTLTAKGDQFVSTTVNAQGKVSDSFDAIKGFRDSLNHQWITTEVLTKALGKYANESEDVGRRAYEAATKVKTFSQLIDTLKEAVGSGWAKTFELFIGDFEQAKELFTSISDAVGGFIENISNARNDFLEELLGGTTKSAGEVAEAVETAGETIEKVTGTFEEYRKIADEIWHGDWDNGAERMKKLTDAGYDYDAAMQIVNNDAYGWEIDMSKYADTTQEAADATNDAAEATKRFNELSQKSGRELLIESLANTAKAAIAIFRTLGEAWRQVFPAPTVSAVKRILIAFHELSSELIIHGKTVFQLRNVFIGVLSVIRIFADAVIAAGRVAIPLVVKGAVALAKGFLTIAEPIGRFVEIIGKAVRETDFFYKILNGIKAIGYNLFYNIGQGIRGVMDVFGITLPKVSDFRQSLVDAANNVAKFIESFKMTPAIVFFRNVFSNIPGIMTKAAEAIKGAAEWVKNLFESIKNKTSISEALSRFGKIGDTIKAIFTVQTDAIKKFVDVIGHGLLGIPIGEDSPLAQTESFFSKFAIGGMIESVVSKLETARDAIVNFFKSSRFIANVKESFTNAFTAVKNAIPAIIENIVEAFSRAVIFASDAKEKLTEFWSSFKQTQGFQNFKTTVGNVLGDVYEVVLKVQEKVSAFFSDLFEVGKKFKFPEIKLPKIDIKPIVDKASEAIGKFSAKIEEIRGSIRAFFANIKIDENNPLHKIYAYFSSLSLQGIVDSVVTKFKRAGNAISKFFKDTKLATKAQTAFSIAVAKVKETAPTVFSGLVKVISKIGSVIIGAKDKVIEFWNAFKETKGFEILKTGVISAFNNLVELIGKAGGKVGEFFKRLFGDAKDFKMPEISMDGIAEKVSSAIEWIKEKFEGLKSALSWFFLTDGTTIGSNALSAIGEFFTSIDWLGIVDSVTETLSKAKDVIVEFLGVLSELVFGKDVKAATMEGVSETIDSLSETIEESTSPLDKFIGVIDVVRDAVMRTLDALKPFFLVFTGFKVAKGFWGIFDFLKGFGGIFKNADKVLNQTQKAIKRVSKAIAFEINSKAIRNVAISLGILAASMFALGHLTPDQFDIAVKGLWAITFALIALMGAFALFFGKGIFSGGGVGEALSPLQDFEKIMAEFGTKMSKALNKFGIAAIIISVVAAIKILIDCVKELSEIDTPALWKGGIALAAIGAALYFMVSGLTKSAGDFSFGKGMGMAALMLAISGAVYILASAVAKLGKMKLGDLIKGGIAVGALITVLGGFVFLADGVDLRGILPIIGLIAEILIGMLLLSFIPIDKIATIGSALGKVFLSVAALTAAIGYAEKQTVPLSGSKLAGVIGGVAAIIAEVMGGLALMTELPDEQIARIEPIANGLGKINASIALVVAALGYFEKHDDGGLAAIGNAGKGAIKAVLGTKVGKIVAIILGVGALIAAVVDTATDIADGENGNGTDLLGKAADVIGRLEKPIGEVGASIGRVVGKLGAGLVEGFTDMSPKELAEGFLTELKSFPETMQNWIEGITGLLTDTKAAYDEGKIDPTAINDFASIIETVKTMSTDIAQIASNFFDTRYNNEAYIGITDEGAPDILSGSTSLTEWLTGWGTAFSEFANSITTTVLDPNSVNETFGNVTSMLESFGGILTAAKKLDSIEEANAKIALLPDIGAALVKYSWSVLFLNTGAVAGTEAAIDIINAAASKAITNATASQEGFTAFVGAGSALAQYSNDLPKYGEALKKFCEAVDGMEAYSNVIASVQTSGGIINALADSAVTTGRNNIVTSDNFSGFVTALSSVSGDLPGFATGLKDFAMNIAGMEKYQGSVTSTRAAVDIINELAREGVRIGNENITGMLGPDGPITALSTYSGNLEGFGKAMVKYAWAISHMKTDAVTKSNEAVSMIVNLTKDIPDVQESSFFGYLFKDNALTNFSTNLPEVAKAFVTFSQTAADFEEANAFKVIDAFGTLVEISSLLAGFSDTAFGDEVFAGVEAATELVSQSLYKFAYKYLPDDEAMASVVEFGESVGEAIRKSFIEGVGKSSESGGGEEAEGSSSLMSGIVEKMLGNTSNVTKDVSSAIESAGIGKAIFDAIQTDVTNLTDLVLDMTAIITAATEGIETGEEAFEGSGEKLASALASGISGSRYSVYNAGYYTGLSGASGARGAYSAFYSAGSYVSEGYAAGIRSQITAVRNAAAALSAAGQVKTAKSDDSHSPSRVYMKLGSYVGQGYAIGILNSIPFVKDAAEEMSVLSVGSAEDALKNRTDQMFKQASLSIAAAYAYINEVASQSLDSTPVITPVLDMTNLQNGMYSMGSLWNMNLNNPFTYANSMFPGSYQYANTMRANTDFVTQTELRGIRSDIKQLGEAITNMNMVLDSGTLVGQLTPGIDRGLGSIAGMKERWA